MAHTTGAGYWKEGPGTLRVGGGGTDRGGHLVIAATLQGGGRRGHRVDAEGAAGGHLIAAPLTAGSATGKGVNAPGRRKEDDENLVIAHALTSEGADASEDGTGRGTPLVAYALASHHQRDGDGDTTYVTEPMAFAENQRGEVVETPHSHQLTTGGGKPGQGYPAIHTATAVRRLTPTECERLQGFPDGWTGGQSDSARYRQLGNSVAVPVVEWIVQRIAALEAAAEPSCVGEEAMA